MYRKNSLRADWITNKEGLGEAAIEWAEGFGSFLATFKGTYQDSSGKTISSNEKELSTTQLRRFFGQIKRLQAAVQSNEKGFDAEKRSELLMLKPQLAYAVGRNKKRFRGKLGDETKIGHFYDELKDAMGYVKETQHFKNFVNLVEAVVAYHKLAGGQ